MSRTRGSRGVCLVLDVLAGRDLCINIYVGFGLYMFVMFWVAVYSVIRVSAVSARHDSVSNEDSQLRHKKKKKKNRRQKML